MWHEAGVQVGGRVRGPGTAIGTHGDTGHAFNTAGNHQVFPPGTNLHRRQVDGLKARRTEAVQGDTGYNFVPVRSQGGGFGNIRTLIANGGHAAHNDVVHLGGVQAVSFL